MQNEPVLGGALEEPAVNESGDHSVGDRIRSLVSAQPFAVLCTQGEGQPYGSVVGFAFTRSLRSFVFATPTATRKYRLLSECDQVALVVDSRGSYSGDLMEVEAVTVTGRAQQVEDGQQFEEYARLLVERHPYLASFIDSPSTALFPVDTVRFLHVMRFQEVCQWIPTPDGSCP